MAEGIKDKVAIIGMGCTKFGERYDKSPEDLMIEAYKEALEDAGIEPKDIQAAWLANQLVKINVGDSSIPLSTTMKWDYIPVTRLENMCASGSEALRAASYAVASGAVDIAFALGVEKCKDVGYGGLPPAEEMSVMGTMGRMLFPSWANMNPGNFAMLALSYFERYGLSIEEGKKVLAHISVKSHHNGMLNPKAHLHKEITIDDVMKAPIISSPLGLYDCCGVSDGAACVIVCRADMAKNFRSDPIYVKAVSIAAESGQDAWHQAYDYTHVEMTRRAAARAYKEAGITDPRKEISCFEVHDCFSITEMVTYEDLGISPVGKAADDIRDGFYDLDGKVPCQTDGGLKCFGHPIGASGLRMVYEMYKQLQGKAGERQVKNPVYGLTHNLGGQPTRAVCAITIIGK